MVPSDDAHTFILERQYTEIEVIQGNLITFQTPIKKKFAPVKYTITYRDHGPAKPAGVAPV